MSYRFDVIRRPAYRADHSFLRLRLEFDDFHSSRFHDLLISLFDVSASDGFESRFLDGILYRNDIPVLFFRADSFVNGSSVYLPIFVARPRSKYFHLRTMSIAD